MDPMKSWHMSCKLPHGTSYVAYKFPGGAPGSQVVQPWSFSSCTYGVCESNERTFWSKITYPMHDFEYSKSAMAIAQLVKPYCCTLLSNWTWRFCSRQTTGINIRRPTTALTKTIKYTLHARTPNLQAERATQARKQRTWSTTPGCALNPAAYRQWRTGGPCSFVLAVVVLDGAGSQGATRREGLRGLLRLLAPPTGLQSSGSTALPLVLPLPQVICVDVLAQIGRKGGE